MMRLAAPERRVLFVEHLAGLEHFLKYADLRRRRWQRWREGLREIKPDLWLLSPPPLLPGRYYWGAMARFNAAVVQRWLTPYLRRLKFNRPILWLYQPEHSALVGRFDELLVVYHCIDEFAAGIQGRKRRVITALETDLLKRADIVFANSRLIYRHKQKLNPNTCHLPSGADVEHFAGAANSSAEIPAEIAQLPHPILAYVGNIDERIDMSLLNQLAQARPHWTLLLIGQAHAQAPGWRALQSMENVIWLGKRSFETLPNLLRGVDLCLLPYVQGEQTRYRSPLKLYEYLATGKPVVATPQPEVDEFAGLINIASPAEFVETAAIALQTDTPHKQQQRLAVARQHSWDKRVETINHVLAKHGVTT